MALDITDADIVWAAQAFSIETGTAPVDTYAKARAYYNGVMDLGFATPKFQSTFGSMFKSFAYNRCRPVVDAQANNLKVKGFQVNGVDLAGLSISSLAGGTAGTQGQDASGVDYAGQAQTLWRLGGMALREGEIYAESAMLGDAYGVVYFDAAPPLGTGLPRIWPNRAETMRVLYDDDGRIIKAAKSWLITTLGENYHKRRLTIYSPNSIARFITASPQESALPKDAAQYVLVKEANFLGQPIINPVSHDLGRVPVIHYPNNASMLGDYGVSELLDVIPLQDALNKAIADMLVAMEYNAFPQRYAIGIESPEPDEITGKKTLPWKAGPGEVWYTTKSQQEAAFGSFSVAELKQFLSVQDQFDLDIARVSHTPVHWLIMTGTPPSGDSLKAARAPFSAKIQDRQRSYGSAHAEALQIMFMLLGVKEPLLIDVEWESADPRSELEQATIGKIMADAGMPLSIVGKAMGLDEQDMLELMAAEDSAASAQAQALAQVQAGQLEQQLNADNTQAQGPGQPSNQASGGFGAQAPAKPGA